MKGSDFWTHLYKPVRSRLDVNIQTGRSVYAIGSYGFLSRKTA